MFPVVLIHKTLGNLLYINKLNQYTSSKDKNDVSWELNIPFLLCFVNSKFRTHFTKYNGYHYHSNFLFIFFII